MKDRFDNLVILQRLSGAECQDGFPVGFPVSEVYIPAKKRMKFTELKCRRCSVVGIKKGRKLYES